MTVSYNSRCHSQVGVRGALTVGGEPTAVSCDPRRRHPHQPRLRAGPRRHLVNGPARLAHHAHGITLHLPKHTGPGPTAG